MDDSHDDDALLSRQLSFYDARAGEYDDWWLRRGRYDRGEELNERWFSECRELRRAVYALGICGSVLELACGTGIWTELLAGSAQNLTALDASPEMLRIARERVGSRVRFVRDDIFAWRPDALYDAVFFSFWLSHVPAGRFAAFWQFVRSCLAPAGRAIFIDSLLDPTSTAVDHHLGGTGRETRRLNDGREFDVVKIYREPLALSRELAELGWDARVQRTGTYFVYGTAVPRV